MENVRKNRDIKIVTTNENKLFSIRTKLSDCEVFHGRYIGYRNEKNSNTYE